MMGILLQMIGAAGASSSTRMGINFSVKHQSRPLDIDVAAKKMIDLRIMHIKLFETDWNTIDALIDAYTREGAADALQISIAVYNHRIKVPMSNVEVLTPSVASALAANIAGSTRQGRSRKKHINSILLANEPEGSWNSEYGLLNAKVNGTDSLFLDRACRNVHAALVTAGLDDTVKVSTFQP